MPRWQSRCRTAQAPDHAQAALDHLDAGANTFDELLAVASQTDSSRYAALREAFTSLNNDLRAIAADIPAALDNPAAADALIAAIDALEADSAPLTANLSTTIAAKTEELEAALEGPIFFRTMIRTAVPPAMLIIVVLGVTLTYWLSRIVAGPIVTLTELSEEVAAGDYTKQAPADTTDELGRLGASFNMMVDTIAQRERELRDQAARLRVATAKANEAARVKGEFMANVSHELRTPLNAIIGFSDMLLMGMNGELNDKQRHRVSRLRDNGQRLLDLVNDILDITRIEARRIELIPKAFSPQDLAGRMTEQMKVLAEEKQLDFKTIVDPDLPETLYGDVKRIEQVVINLLSNAFKFTEDGAVSLTMRALNTDEWQIQVADTGIGIPPHAKELIFEEFRQLDGSYTRAYQGTGLGLAISRNLVRIMEGTIQVQSELGSGSTFTVTLPMIFKDPIQDLLDEHTLVMES
jgi:signal transduction histidine kinase